MKWLVFIVALTVGVPAMAFVLRLGERWVRAGILAFFLLLANDLNGGLSINLISMEWYRGDSRGIEVTALDLISLALLLLVLTKRPPGFWRRLITPEMGLFGLYLCMAIVSALGAAVPEYSMFGLWKILRGLMICVIFTQLIDRRERVELLIKAFALVALMQAPVVFHQKYIQGIYRAYGTLPHMNTLAMLMNLTMLPVFAWWLMVGREPRPWLVAAMAAAAFNLLATGSRGGMVSLLVGMGIVALFLRPRHLSPRRLRWMAFMTVAGILGLSMVMDTVIRRFETAPAASAQTRVDLNACATLMARDFVFGVGLNNYSHMIGHSRYGELAPVEPGYGRDDAVAHHIYWLTAAELGWPGLVAFLLFIGAFQLRALGLALWARDPLCRAAGVGLFAGLFALHLQGFLEWVLRQTNIWFLFCAVIGTVSAVRQLEASSARQRAPAPAARPASTRRRPVTPVGRRTASPPRLAAQGAGEEG